VIYLNKTTPKKEAIEDRTMDQDKICPVCEIEYMPHIEKCADCGAVLLSHEEYRRAQEERKRLTEEAIENAVVVRKGDLKWLTELYNVLIDAGIPCTVTSDGCNKGCRGAQCSLIVSPEDVEKAQERIAEYYMEMHPELRVSNELISQGKCPACGSPVSAGDIECPDCGLTLVVIEDEDREEESCGG
jgi:ribosomal protein L32